MPETRAEISHWTNVPNGLIERFDKEPTVNLRQRKDWFGKEPEVGDTERERETHIGAPSLMGGEAVI